MQHASSNGASNQEQALRAQLEILQNHDSEHSASPAASRSPHGYDERQFTPSNDAGQPASTGVEAHIHPDLREAQSQAQAQAAESMMQMGPPGSHSPNSTGAPGPGAPLAPAPPSIPEDPRKPKRELSQSKRAAQNRAAQRAFRQRKEGYIKKLEQQVREFNDLENSFKQIQSENYALRDYVLHLQARLLETSGDVPAPPPNVNLGSATANSTQIDEHQHQQQHQHQQHHDHAASNPGAGTPLEAVAKAVAGLAAQEQLRERQGSPSFSPKIEGGDEDTRSADEINRHLNPEDVAEQS